MRLISKTEQRGLKMSLAGVGSNMFVQQMRATCHDLDDRSKPIFDATDAEWSALCEADPYYVTLDAELAKLLRNSLTQTCDTSKLLLKQILDDDHQPPATVSGRRCLALLRQLCCTSPRLRVSRE